MSFFRTLQTDLRERQIFPAVVVLVVLAVGIPIFASAELSKVSTPATPAIATPPLQPPAGVKTPQQELADLNSTPVPTSVTRRGAEPDPFREATATPSGGTSKASSSKPPSVVKTPTPSTPVPSKSTTKTSTTKPGSTGSTGSTGQGSPATGPATLKSDQAYTVDIDTKDATGVHALSDVVRLAPLPAAQSPEVIYLGVLQGGTKAAFLFTNAIAVTNQTGQSMTCLPSAADCQIVELSPGQGLSLYPTSNSSLIATFTFELVSIGAASYSSDAAATAARDAVSTAGQTLLPLSDSTELQTLSYNEKIGALVHRNVPSHGSTGSSGSSGSTGSTGSTGTTGSNGSGGDSLMHAVALDAAGPVA